MNPNPLSHPLSRRGLLQGAAGAATLATLMSLGACAPSPSSGPSAATRNLLGVLPGDEPVGWAEVKAALNKKLEADLGITYTPEFIPWANYAQNELLKFTSGEQFDLTLEARWLHMDQLLADGALADLTEYWESGKYPELNKTIEDQFVKYSRDKGKVRAIPQINAIGAVAGFALRQDLVDKYGGGEVTNFQQLEKFLYDVKQHERKMIPFGLDSGYANNTLWATPTGLLNEYSWSHPDVVNQLAHGLAYMDPSGGAGNSRPAPFWEGPGFEDAVKKVRQYFLDKIINHDAISADQTSTWGQFSTGLYGATVAVNDGGTTARFSSLATNVPGASLFEVMPFADGLKAKIATNFVVANYVVANTSSANVEQVMAFQNWLSVQENHDLVAYGIQGRDWEPAGERSYKSLSKYAFPTFALAWRVPLERSLDGMIPSSQAWFDWAKDVANFKTDPYSGFQFDQTPVSTELAQLDAAFTQYVLPLAVGTVDTTKGMSDMKKAMDEAGLDKVLGELKTQADAFLAGK